MVSTNEYKTDTKISHSMYFALTLFVIVILSTIGLYFYNNSLVSQNDLTNTEIAKIETEIQALKNNDKIFLYTLIATNKGLLDKYAYISQIPEYINNLKDLSKTFRVDLQGFSYSNGSINTSATAKDDIRTLGYKKVENFIGNFRDVLVGTGTISENKNLSQIFTLSFIDTFQGQSEMRFGVHLQLK